jgi:hypothetical protein
MHRQMTVVALAPLHVSVARARPPLAIIYGVGAYWIVFWLAIGVFVNAFFFVRLPVSTLYFPAATLAASAVAVAVALRSAGWVSAVGLSIAAIAYALVLECGPSAVQVSGPCSLDLGRFLRGHAAEVVGALVGLPVALALRPRDGRSALLLAAGIVAIAVPLARVVFSPFDPVTGSAASERYLWTVRLQAGAAIAGGAVLGTTARRPIWALLTLGAGLLLPWFGGTFRQWWLDLRELQGQGISMNLAAIIQTQWQSFLPLIYLALLLVGFAVARAGTTLMPIARGPRSRADAAAGP